MCSCKYIFITSKTAFPLLLQDPFLRSCNMPLLLDLQTWDIYIFTMEILNSNIFDCFLGDRFLYLEISFKKVCTSIERVYIKWDKHQQTPVFLGIWLRRLTIRSEKSGSRNFISALKYGSNIDFFYILIKTSKHE